MSFLHEDVGDDGIAYGSGNQEYFPCLLVCLITEIPFTNAPIRVGSQTTVLSLIDWRSDVVEKHQSIIAPGTMDMFLGPSFQGNLANFFGKWIIANASIGPHYIVRPQKEGQ